MKELIAVLVSILYLIGGCVNSEPVIWESGKEYTYKVRTVAAGEDVQLDYTLTIVPAGSNTLHCKPSIIAMSPRKIELPESFLKGFTSPMLLNLRNDVIVSLQTDIFLPQWIHNIKRLQASYFILDNSNSAQSHIPWESKSSDTNADRKRFESDESSVEGKNCKTRYLIWKSDSPWTNEISNNTSGTPGSAVCSPQAQLYKLTKTMNLAECQELAKTESVVKTRISVCAEEEPSLNKILHIERNVVGVAGSGKTTISLQSIQKIKKQVLEAINNPKTIQLQYSAQNSTRIADQEGSKLERIFFPIKTEGSRSRHNFNLTQNPGDDLQEQFLKMFYPGIPAIPRNLPDLSEISRLCPRNALFNSFSPDHRQAVRNLKIIFQNRLTASTPRSLINLAWAIRDNPQMNLYVWYEALEALSLHEPVFEALRRPSPLEAMPESFIDARAIEAAQRQLRSPEQSPHRLTQNVPNCVVVDESFGADNGFESLLWYFREDIMLNAHHWYYHLTYPGQSVDQREDRRGELFYYIHHSMLARYNAERLSNGLSRTQHFALNTNPFNIFIEEGFDPHMTEGRSSRQSFQRRTPFVRFSDIIDPNNGQVIASVGQHIVQASIQIFQAISTGGLQHQNGNWVPLDAYTGIDLLADVVEANGFSVNPQLYSQGGAGFHNSGHNVIAGAMDPTGQSRLPLGVMSQLQTSMRDPIFYRWHTYVDTIFSTHKAMFPNYQEFSNGQPGNEFPVHWSTARIQRIGVFSQQWRGGVVPGQNQLQTFWNYRRFTLPCGLDFDQQPQTPSCGRVNMCAKHLDHSSFLYQIVVDNLAFVNQRATIRIFMAPKLKENFQPFRNIEEQQPFFFVMDTWQVNLLPGTNIIYRSSTDSILTRPWVDTLNQVNTGTQGPNYCGCGYPHHMLLPKGSPGGVMYDLFVMVTDANIDEAGVVNPNDPPEPCRSAWLLCGIGNRRYPDTKPMGYPFDRPIRAYGNPIGLENWIYGVPNMASTQIRITHSEF